MEAEDGVDLKQVWFSGVHADIGGGYGPSEQTGTTVSDVALGWMLDEAKGAGLVLERHVRAPPHRRRHAPAQQVAPAYLQSQEAPP